MMKIKSRHLLYAAKKSLWIIPVLTIGLREIVVLQRGIVDDFTYGMIPIILIGTIYLCIVYGGRRIDCRITATVAVTPYLHVRCGESVLDSQLILPGPA